MVAECLTKAAIADKAVGRAMGYARLQPDGNSAMLKTVCGSCGSSLAPIAEGGNNSSLSRHSLSFPPLPPFVVCAPFPQSVGGTASVVRAAIWSHPCRDWRRGRWDDWALTSLLASVALSPDDRRKALSKWRASGLGGALVVCAFAI
eukprot:gene1510-36076_t